MPPGYAEGNTDGGTDKGSPHDNQPKGAGKGGIVLRHPALVCGHLEPTDLVGPGVLASELYLESAFGGGTS